MTSSTASSAREQSRCSRIDVTVPPSRITRPSGVMGMPCAAARWVSSPGNSECLGHHLRLVRQGQGKHTGAYRITHGWISQSGTLRSWSLHQVVGGGLGAPCEPVFPPTEEIPQCGDLILLINGVLPAESGAFTLMGSNGIYVDARPALHKIIIRGEIDKQIICAE